MERALGEDSRLWKPACSFSWGDPKRAQFELAEAAKAFAAEARSGPWQLAWCAGTGVVATRGSALDDEVAALSALLEALSDSFAGNLSGGAVFLASSAGAVYAGVGAAPYTEQSPVAPISEYGRTKLAQEQLATRWCIDAGVPLLIGRLSNVYGPGQDLSKGQGLINQVCLRIIARQPLHLYVPADTIRDYLYADDAGRLIAMSLRRLRRDTAGRDAPLVTVKILASHQPLTIASVLAQYRWITKRPVSVIFGASPDSRLQVRDLRMRSEVWPEVDHRTLTPLSEGMRSVLTRILELAGTGRITIDKIGGY